MHPYHMKIDVSAKHLITPYVHCLQRFGPDTGGGGGGGTQRDTRYLRDMVRDLEEANEQLKAEIKDLNRDLNAEKRAAEKVRTSTCCWAPLAVAHFMR